MEPSRAALTSHLRAHVMNDLTKGLEKQMWFLGFDIPDELPVKYSMEEWIAQAQDDKATVFIAGSVPNFFLFLISLTSALVFIKWSIIDLFTHIPLQFNIIIVLFYTVDS